LEKHCRVPWSVAGEEKGKKEHSKPQTELSQLGLLDLRKQASVIQFNVSTLCAPAAAQLMKTTRKKPN
jgi:hypothetical protein